MLYEKLNILFQIEAVEITRWYSFHTLVPVLFTIYLQMKFDMAYSSIKYTGGQMEWKFQSKEEEKKYVSFE